MLKFITGVDLCAADRTDLVLILVAPQNRLGLRLSRWTILLSGMLSCCSEKFQLRFNEGVSWVYNSVWAEMRSCITS